MKQKRNLLLTILLSGILGWILGFLRFPYLEKDFSFSIGFIAGLALVSLGALLLFVWNKNALLLQLIGKNTATDESQNPIKLYKTIWILVAAFIVVGGLVSSFLISKQNKFSKNQTLLQNKKIVQQAKLLASTRKSNSLILINDVFDWIDEDLKNNPDRKLSEATIARIDALNYSFEPYSYVQGDSLSEKKWSPERGQLLLMLSTVKMDSSSFNQIKREISFNQADLQNADLSGADLSGVDLSNSNLKNINLSNANLTNAILHEANLWGANLTNAILFKTDMRTVDFSWANMNKVKINGANLKWANMISTNLKEADLNEVDLSWSNMTGVFFNQANLIQVNLEQSYLNKSNLSQIKLTNSNLRWTDLSEANLDKANFNETSLDRIKVYSKNWFEQLSEWKVTGIKDIQEKYKIADGINNTYNFHIEKIPE